MQLQIFLKYDYLDSAQPANSVVLEMYIRPILGTALLKREKYGKSLLVTDSTYYINSLAAYFFLSTDCLGCINTFENHLLIILYFCYHETT